MTPADRAELHRLLERADAETRAVRTAAIADRFAAAALVVDQVPITDEAA